MPAFRYRIIDGVFQHDSPKAFELWASKIVMEVGDLVLHKDEPIGTDEQRKYWFAVIVVKFMEYMGYRINDKTARDYVSKEILKEVGWWEEKPDLRGVLQRQAKSIARGKITTKEMSDMIDGAIQLGAELEVIIPDPQSAQAAVMMEGK